MPFSVIRSLGLAFLAAFLIAVAPPAEASPSATMRFMEHLHSSAPATHGGEAQLFGELLARRAKVTEIALLCCCAVAPLFLLVKQKKTETTSRSILLFCCCWLVDKKSATMLVVVQYWYA